MTINEAISRCDDLKPNSFSQKEKVEWLSRLDGRIKNDIIDTHEGAELVSFKVEEGYSIDKDGSRELIVPSPYDDIYIHWLHAQIDYHLGEIHKYNNCMAMFNASLQIFSDYYNRKHMPKEKRFKFF